MEHERNPNEIKEELDHAIQHETVEAVLSLFDNGMDINQTDHQGRTALQMMSFMGKEQAVETLIAKGANVNAVFMYQGRLPMTALDAARDAKKNAIVDILLLHGAKTGKELQE